MANVHKSLWQSFDKPSVSDCRLDLVTACQARTASKRSKTVLKCIHISKAILAPASEFFQALFDGLFLEATAKHVEIEVEPEDVDLMYELIKSVYTSKVADTLSLSQILSTFRLCDKYLMTDALALYAEAASALSAKLKNEGSKIVSDFLTSTQLQGWTNTVFDQSIKVALCECFGNMEKLVSPIINHDTSDLTLAKFMALPHFARMSVLESELVLSSENFMWTLVCFLVGQTDVPDEQIALLKCIPYDRLSPSVVRDLVLQHELIKKYSLVPYICTMLLERRMEPEQKTIPVIAAHRASRPAGDITGHLTVKLIRNIAGFWVREGDLDQEQVVSFYGLKHKWILKGEHISVHLPGILEHAVGNFTRTDQVFCISYDALFEKCRQTELSVLLHMGIDAAAMLGTGVVGRSFLASLSSSDEGDFDDDEDEDSDDEDE